MVGKNKMSTLKVLGLIVLVILVLGVLQNNESGREGQGLYTEMRFDSSGNLVPSIVYPEGFMSRAVLDEYEARASFRVGDELVFGYVDGYYSSVRASSSVGLLSVQTTGFDDGLRGFDESKFFVASGPWPYHDIRRNQDVFLTGCAPGQHMYIQEWRKPLFRSWGWYDFKAIPNLYYVSRPGQGINLRDHVGDRWSGYLEVVCLSRKVVGDVEYVYTCNNGVISLVAPSFGHYVGYNCDSNNCANDRHVFLVPGKDHELLLRYGFGYIDGEPYHSSEALNKALCVSGRCGDISNSVRTLESHEMPRDHNAVWRERRKVGLSSIAEGCEPVDILYYETVCNANHHIIGQSVDKTIESSTVKAIGHQVCVKIDGKCDVVAGQTVNDWTISYSDETGRVEVREVVDRVTDYPGCEPQIVPYYKTFCNPGYEIADTDGVMVADGEFDCVLSRGSIDVYSKEHNCELVSVSPLDVDLSIHFASQAACLGSGGNGEDFVSVYDLHTDCSLVTIRESDVLEGVHFSTLSVCRANLVNTILVYVVSADETSCIRRNINEASFNSMIHFRTLSACEDSLKKDVNWVLLGLAFALLVLLVYLAYDKTSKRRQPPVRGPVRRSRRYDQYY